MKSSTLSLREERMKQREGDRLYRSLRRMFGGRHFGFQWTHDETSYTDGKTIWVKYDVQTDMHRAFSDAECRVIRHAHGVHERGHIEFDYLPDYLEWQKEMSSSNYEDWKENKKYPLSWCQFFGNMSMDGRMERLVMLKLPSQKEYLDFTNYEWRFGIRGQHAGENRVHDFQECFASRVLGMTDIKEWHEEAVKLVDAHQNLINEIRIQPSTKSCLEKVSEFMSSVWPTLWEWMDMDNHDPQDTGDYHFDDHTNSQWGISAEETQRNAEKVLKHSTEENEEIPESSSAEKCSDDKEENKSPNFSSIIRKAEKESKADEEAVQKELEKEGDVSIEIKIPGLSEKTGETIMVKKFSHQNQECYDKVRNEVKKLIKPTAKALKELLEGTPSQVRRNVRSGRFVPSQAWKAIYCEDSNVFRKHSKGAPSTNAFISFMTDISGSTGYELENGKKVIDEMRAALILLLEACFEAGIPSTAYAFTELDDTEIYRLKPFENEFSDFERASIGGIYPMIGNRDTLALKYALEQAEKRREDIRLVVMLSDGLPVFRSGEGPETIRQMVTDAEKKGIDVLCMFIGHHRADVVEQVQSMYPGRVIAAKKGIARELQKHVKRIVRQRRK